MKSSIDTANTFADILEIYSNETSCLFSSVELPRIVDQIASPFLNGKLFNTLIDD